VEEAFLRVRGASDFAVSLNGVEVARSDPGEPASWAFPVPVALLRAGRNALALEGHRHESEGPPLSLELALFSHASPR
ncbi:MAG TPA: hypothetical protein VGB87_00580, partial [Vicinamibacteria bacterium]